MSDITQNNLELTMSVLKILALAVLISLGACSGTKKGDMATDGSLNGDGSNPAYISGTSLENIEPGTQEELVAAIGDRVFFDTDSSMITSSAQQTLARQAEWLKTNQSISVVVEGHCDERGTREYNLALGERRANSVRDFLISQGISPSRISTISYGKEHPEFLGSNPDAWGKNRRGVTVVTN